MIPGCPLILTQQRDDHDLQTVQLPAAVTLKLTEERAQEDVGRVQKENQSYPNYSRKRLDQENKEQRKALVQRQMVKFIPRKPWNI